MPALLLAFCQQGQGFQQFVFERTLAIENRTFRFGKGPTTPLALEPLPSLLGPAKLADVTLNLTIVCEIRRKHAGGWKR